MKAQKNQKSPIEFSFFGEILLAIAGNDLLSYHRFWLQALLFLNELLAKQEKLTSEVNWFEEPAT